jgi:hypothetical protein
MPNKVQSDIEAIGFTDEPFYQWTIREGIIPHFSAMHLPTLVRCVLFRLRRSAFSPDRQRLDPLCASRHFFPSLSRAKRTISNFR